MWKSPVWKNAPLFFLLQITIKSDDFAKIPFSQNIYVWYNCQRIRHFEAHSVENIFYVKSNLPWFQFYNKMIMFFKFILSSKLSFHNLLSCEFKNLPPHFQKAPPLLLTYRCTMRLDTHLSCNLSWLFMDFEALFQTP